MHQAVNSISENRSGLPGLFFWEILIPAFVFGILSIKWFVPSLSALLIYLFALLFIQPEKGAALLLLVLFGVGNWYGNFVLPPGPDAMPEWMAHREKVHLSGTIHSIRGVPGQQLKILLEDVVCDSGSGLTRLGGLLNWTWAHPDQFPYVGQQVVLYVRVKPIHGFRNSGLWDYDFYCRTKDIRYRTYTKGKMEKGGLKPYAPSGLQKLRANLREHIQKNAPPTQGGALFPALLTGDRFYLSNDSVELIRRAGVSHILALSGLHVGFIVALGFGLSWLAGLVYPLIYLRFSRLQLGILFAVIPVVLYLWLGQFTPSLLRAVCMFAFWGLLMFFNRGRVLLDGLFLAVILILAVSPLSVFDLGFQLSVLAVGGIALFYPYMLKLAPSGHGLLPRAMRFVLTLIYISLCANIALLPVLIWNFGVVTPNLLFNVIFVPVLGLFILPVCGIGGLVLSYISPEAAQILFSAGAGVFEWLLTLVQDAANAGMLPEFAVYRPHWEGLLIYFLLLGILFMSLSGRFNNARPLILPLILLFFLRLYGASCPERVRMDILDTGQSQCVVISGPGGSRTVVDGGGGFGNNFDMGRAVVGPWLTYGHLPQIDNIIMTHGDRDHAGGLAFLLEKFSVGRFYSNGDIPSGHVGERFEAVFRKKEIPTEVLNKGDQIILEPGLVLETLHPYTEFKGSRNNRSLYLRLVWNGHPLLAISGDLDRKGIKELLKNGEDITSNVLVLPHHGSAGSFSPELYERVKPEIVVAACGFLNRFKFVARKIVQELEKRKLHIYTTSGYGMLTVEWNKDGDIEVLP